MSSADDSYIHIGDTEYTVRCKLGLEEAARNQRWHSFKASPARSLVLCVKLIIDYSVLYLPSVRRAVS